MPDFDVFAELEKPMKIASAEARALAEHLVKTRQAEADWIDTFELLILEQWRAGVLAGLDLAIAQMGKRK